LSFKKRFSS